jgi:pyrroloquinoline quinone biosynthesis protein D
MEAKSRRPKLARGCRLRVTDKDNYLLMAESVLRMNSCGGEIVKRCDGSHTVEQIVAELQTLYTGVEAEKLSSEVESFLARLKNRLAIVEV